MYYIVGLRTTLPLGHQRYAVLFKSALFKVQCFSTVQVILSALIQGFSTVQVILSALIQDFSAMQVLLSALIQGSALCKNFQELLVISTSSPRSALFEAVLCEALVCSTFPTFIIKKLKLLCICIFLKCGISNNSCGFEFSN